jgi:chromosomal replication initiation ATPase DnaA
MSQLPLALGGLDAPDFVHFWPGADALVLVRLRALAAAPGAAQVLLLGGEASGKTHLLLATLRGSAGGRLQCRLPAAGPAR